MASGKQIQRPDRMGDIRFQQRNLHHDLPTTDRPVSKPAQRPADEPDVINPAKANIFRPGQRVQASRNRQGTVKKVKEEGVGVDFGLGIHWLHYSELTLIA